MPIYEYKGQQYDVATEDPAAAKAKILSYLEKQGGASAAPAPAAPAPAAPAVSSTAAQNQAEAQARQDIASQGPEQTSIPEAELADAERNVAALTRELKRKGVDVGERPAIGSTKAGDFLLAKGAEAQSQRPAPAAAVVPPAPPVAQTQLAPPPAPPVAQVVPPKPLVAGRFGAAGVGPAAAARVVPSPPSVLEKAPKVVPVVSETQAALNMAGVSPKYVDSLEAEFYQLPIEQRAAALQQAMVENPKNTVKGRAVRAVAARHADWVKAASNLPESTALVDPRREAVNARLAVAQGQLEREEKQKAKAAEARAKLRAEAAAEKYGPLAAAKDVGLSAIKGAVDLSESVTGIADILSFGTVGEILAKTGYYDPEGAKKFYTGLQSATSRDQQQNVQEAKGFVNSLKAIAVNPAALLDTVVSSLPSMVASGTGGGMLVKQLMTKAAAEAATLKLTGEAAAKFVADKVKSQTLKIVAATSAGEGVLTAGSVAEAGRQKGKDWNTYVLPALSAGLGNAAISMVGGQVAVRYGIADVQTSMAARMAGFSDVNLGTGTSAAQVFKQLAKEGILEEMPQSYQEQIFRNLATERPWDEGVDEAAAQGLMAGIAMAGGHQASSRVLRAASSLSSVAEGKIGEAKEGLRESMSKILGVAKTNELLGLREGAYERPKGMNEAIMQANNKRVPFASSSGALNVPPAEKTTAEPKLGDLENVGMQEEEDPGLSSLEGVQAGKEPPFATGEAAPTAEDTEAKVNAIAERLRSRGIPRENALRIAQKQVAEETARTQGAEDVAGTEPTPSGESVSVAGEPGAETPGGLETPARDGVVPTEPDAGLPATGEVSEPAALTETKAEEGTTDGTETVEAKQAETQEQEAPTTNVTLYRGAPKGQRDTVGGALFKSPDKEMAESYAGKEGVVTEEVHSFENPLQAATWAEAKQKLGLPQSATMSNLVAAAREAGHDVVTFKANGQFEYIVLGKKAEAPAAPKPPKAAKPGKEVHTTPQNTEGKWSHAINGEVVKTYDTKTQAIAAMLLDKAQKTGNEELIAKRQKIFDGAMNPQQRGRPPKLVDTLTEDTQETETARAKAAVEKANADAKAAEKKPTAEEKFEARAKANVEANQKAIAEKAKADAEAKAEAAAKATKPKPNLTAEEKERLEELDDIHRNATNNPNTEGGKAAKKTLERVTKDTDEPKVVRERAKAMLAGEYSAPDDNEFFIQAAEGKKDLAFSKFTTASQTLSHIIKTGTDFQKELARRLRSTVRNVKMVVVEKGQELPASVAAVKAKWDRALAMYNTEEKVVYTKGESYGKTNGLNAVVQLHELFHGATSQKIRTALAYMKMGRHVDSQMVKAVDGLQKIMDLARAELNKQIEAGTVDSDVHSLAVYGEAFTNLHEFVSYGNTDAKLQEFLKGVKGFEKDKGLFSPFVDALRRIIGMGKEDATALSDLVQRTDQLISSRRPGGWGFPEVGTLASAAIPPPPGERTQEEMDADDAAAWDKVDRTQMGQKRADALSSFMALRDPRVIWARLEGVWDKIDDPTRKAIALFFDRNGIANTIGKHIPVLYDIADRLQKMDGMAASLRGEAAKQAGMVVNFARKDRKAMEVLNRLIPASTIAGYDPANPPASGVRAVKTDEAYEALKPAGQRVYREVRDYFADMYNAARDIMEASVDSLDLPADAKQKLMASIRLAFEEGKIEPYFPLMRYGDYIFRIKERGSDKYESYRFETKTERNFAAKAYAKEQGVKLKDLVEDNEVDLAEDDGGKEQRGIVESSKLLKEMYEAIDSMDTTDAKAKAKLKDNMYQVYLDLMPEASMRKQFIHREGTVGFGTDTLRMINTQGIKIASALSKLQYGNEIRNLSEQANRQLKGKEQYKAFVGAMDSVIDEALNPKPLGPVAGFFNPVAQQWTKFTFFHNLTSLSSALMQPADILLTGAPVLVGNHGPKAMVELTKMANVVKQFGVWETLPNGTKRFRAPSIAYATGLPQVELDAIADMVGAYGLSSDTLANEIFDAATKPVDKSDPKAVELAKDAAHMLVFGGLMHHTERISREIIGVVSFRLHYAKMKNLPPETRYANAVRAAVAEANEALGDYSPGNRPQIMRGPIGKLLSTYKFFPLTRIKLLGGNFFRMIPFLNKEGKIAAATKFFGILGTHSILTGVVGLPMYGLIQALWGQWQRDEDAPQTMKDLDHDTWWRTEFLRAELGDGQFTKFAKEIAKSGIANYATGMAISERLGLNDMVFRTPSPGKNLKESVANYAEAFFGAQLTPIKATQDSWDYYSQGEYQKMFESLPFMPKSISALSATERISREGIETKQGIPILDKGEVTTKELIGQALGFQSARVAEARRIAYATDLIERGIGTEKQAIVGKAATFFLKAINPNRDPEDRQRFLNMYLETVQKIPKFNIKYPEYGIDGKEIDAKIDAELEKIAASKMFGGVKINDNNIRLFIQAALASREALNNPK